MPVPVAVRVWLLRPMTVAALTPPVLLCAVLTAVLPAAPAAAPVWSGTTTSAPAAMALPPIASANTAALAPASRLFFDVDNFAP